MMNAVVVLLLLACAQTTVSDNAPRAWGSSAVDFELDGMSDTSSILSVEDMTKVQRVLAFREEQRAQAYLETSRGGELDFYRNKQIGDVRVMTWNIHMAWMYANEMKEKEQTWPLILREIDMYRPDVLLLQESPPKVDQRLLAEYPYQAYCKYGVHSSNRLYTLSKLPIVQEKTKRFLDRCVLHTFVKTGKAPVLITNVHLSHGSQKRRHDELVSSKKFAATLGVPHIIGGDYNDPIEAFNNILNDGRGKEYYDAFEVANQTPNDEPTQWRGTSIDFFMTTEPQLVSNVYLVHSDASDHLPLILDISPRGANRKFYRASAFKRKEGLGDIVSTNPMSTIARSLALKRGVEYE